MSTHWKKMKNPDYLGAWDFQPKEERILTIKSFASEQIFNPSSNKKEQCTVLHFDEKSKPMVLNATNAKAIEKLHGTPFMEEWVGRKIQIYVEKVKAFGDVVDSLRIRGFVKAQTTQYQPRNVCADCNATVTDSVARRAMEVFGVVLCGDCGQKRKSAEIIDKSEVSGDEPSNA